jgi:hypothetical protein
MATYCEICKTDFDDKRTCKCAVVSVELTGDEAQAFAQFLKRTILDDYKAKCSPASVGGEEPYTMQAAGGKIRAALAAAGFNPR